VRLTPDEIRAFLRDAHTGTLTSLRRDGWPVSLPVWFVAEGERVWVRTPERSKKVARIRNDERVSFQVESGLAWIELAAVVLTGRATIVEDAEEIARVGRAFDAKYERFRRPAGSLPAATERHYAVPFATIRVDPVQPPLSWQNAKLLRRV
jgi:PPOX class probable F420-dependent enzyme